MVCTFYSSTSPGSKPFISVGDHVNEGDVVCIVEAMKMMNEIKSEFSGKVLSIKVENSQPVEYGQTLFEIGK
jgi:acetyl-CoA carboxylase biotin carboxyl carrier protein